MRFVLLGLLGLGLFAVTQVAENTVLAYFSFLPLALLVAFYFYDLKDWFFLGVVLVLLGITYALHVPLRVTTETAGIFGGTAALFGILIYGRKGWEGVAGVEEARGERARQELTGLREKNAGRTESLRHIEKQVASLINLFEIARDFNECLDLKEMCQVLFKKVLPELPFDRSELLALEPGPEKPTIQRAYLISSLGVEELSMIAEESREHQWIGRIGSEKGFVAQDNVWLFPLVLEGEFNALLAVEGAQKDDLAKFEVLASQLALQVRKIRLYEKVRELSIIDGLTGVFVRRHFLERFEEELRRAMNHKFPLAVLMLDIDYFKRYNDDFGHLVGDVTLREVAQVIRANVRNVDIVARYGGEEFVAVIPETKEDGALEAAERIRSAVARRPFRVYDEETRATLSIGVSIFPQDVSEETKGDHSQNLLFELLQKADRALYQAKEEGRNRVVAFRSLK